MSTTKKVKYTIEVDVTGCDTTQSAISSVIYASAELIVSNINLLKSGIDGVDGNVSLKVTNQ